jgi:HEAT repeat protein
LEGVRNKPNTALVRGRALYSLKRPDEGLTQYKDALLADPGILRRNEVLQDLSQNLGGRQSQDAADLMVQAGDPAIELLAEASRDPQNPRRSRAAIDALRRLKREDRVDPVLVHLQNLRSKECAVVVKAAKALGEIGDRRAIGPLREITQRKMLLFEPCEVPAARAALRKFEKK